MKRFGAILAVCAACAFLPGSAFSQEQSTGDKRLLVAVVDFKNQSGDAAHDPLAAGITGTLITELQKTKTFRLVERERLESVLNELKLGMSGLVDPVNAKEVGKQLGVDALLFGNLSAVKYSQSKNTIGIMWTEAQKTEVSLDARLVRVDTGEVLASSQVSVPVSQRKWVAFWFAKIGKTVEKTAIVSTGIESSCKRLAKELAGQVQ